MRRFSRLPNYNQSIGLFCFSGMSAIGPCVLCNFATSDEDEMSAHFDEKHHNLASRKRKKVDKNSNAEMMMSGFDEESSRKSKSSKKDHNENFSKKNRVSHKDGSSSRSLKCNFCSKSFVKLKVLQNHVRSKHPYKVETGPEMRKDRVKKIEKCLTDDDFDVDQREKGDQRELEEQGLERERRSTNDLVVQSVSSMIKQQLREKQISQGLGISENENGFRRSAEQNSERNKEFLIEYPDSAGSGIKCNLCERILPSRFCLRRHLMTAHPETPDKDHQNYKPKITNPVLANDISSNEERQHTIKVFEANGRTLGVTVKDQMMLTKILSRTCSIQLNLRFSGTGKRARCKQANRSSSSKRHPVGQDSIKEEEDGEEDEGQSNEQEPEQVDPVASASAEPDKKKATLWCSKCGLEFSEVEDLHLHLSEHRLADKENPNPSESILNHNSEMTFIKTEVDGIKADNDDDNLFICVICNQVFDSEASLTTHEDEVHIRKESKLEAKLQLGIGGQPANPEKPFSCSVCCKLFSYLRSKTKHEEKYHGIEPPTSFSDPGNQLEGNDQDSGNVPDPINKGEANGSFACNICNKSYSRISTLKEHHLVLHEQKLDFECSQCHQGFVTGAKLRSHQKRRHKFVEYSCKSCNEKFSSKESFNEHKLRHS